MDRNAFNESLGHGNLLYDVMACSAIGGGTLALFFFLLDIIDGHALFTPSLMGAVLFQGADAGSFQGISLSLTAGYTVMHFAVFAVVGLVMSLVVHAADFSEDRVTPIVVAILAIELAFFASVTVFLPGIIEVIGAGRIIVANILAGGGIGVYLIDLRHRVEWRSAAADRTKHHA